jgi:hypothetical protein
VWLNQADEQAPLAVVVGMLLTMAYMGGYLALLRPHQIYLDAQGNTGVSHYRIDGFGYVFMPLAKLDNALFPDRWFQLAVQRQGSAQPE